MPEQYTSRAIALSSFDEINPSTIPNNSSPISAKIQSLGLQSKRPQVKTSPSQNVPELVKTSPKLVKMSPWYKMLAKIFYYIFYVIFGIICDVWKKTVLDKAFYPDSILLLQFFRQSFYTQSFIHYIFIYSLAFDDLIIRQSQWL